MGVKNIIGELQVNGKKVVTEDTLENVLGGGSSSDSVVGTWKFNDYLNIPQEFFGNSFKVSFTTTGWGNETIRMDTIYFYDDDGDEIICYYGDDGDYDDIYVNSWPHGYNFNIITITEEPTDTEFITWLKANAVKQVAPPLPPCDSANEGQFLRVENGIPTWVTVATVTISYDESAQTLSIDTTEGE